ncbi:MAG: hypothetical protein PHV49_06260 [Alistipes sp.]|nr:hypothetical protein [Alistipes sp.]
MAAQPKKPKKRVVISYKNLTEALRELIKEQYPNGYTDQMIRIDKAPGDFFYAIVLETEEICYLVKVDVKIDDKVEEDKEDFFEEEDESLKEDDNMDDQISNEMEDEE